MTVTNENGDYYIFPVHKWFDKHQDDQKLSRDLTPTPTQNKQKKDEIESNKELPEPRQPLGEDVCFVFRKI